VDEIDVNTEQAYSEAHQPFLLLALNATDTVEWEELDNKVWLFFLLYSLIDALF
jgi:hypothetical protein